MAGPKSIQTRTRTQPFSKGGVTYPQIFDTVTKVKQWATAHSHLGGVWGHGPQKSFELSESDSEAF